MTDTMPRLGVIGACLTPFDPDGNVDGAALERLIDFMVGHCDAVSVLGAEASEYRALSDAGRRTWLRHGVAAVEARVPVLAGASSPRVAEVVELAELAAGAGADYAQVLIPRRPWGPEASPAELVAYFEAVAAASPLPIVAYHNPTRGSDPPVDTLIRIGEIERVVGFKESSRDISRIGRLIAEIDRADKARYFTTMQPLLPTLMQGGSGGMMPVPASVIGARVVRAFRDGDLAAASETQRLFALFPASWAGYGLAPVMKAALRHMGIDAGDSLAPFANLSARDSDALCAFLGDAGLLDANSADDHTSVPISGQAANR